MGKFSKLLPTSRRKSLSELRESDVSLGSWNADATQSNRPMGDFSEVLNMRKMKPGELEVRSGVRQWKAPQNFTPELAVMSGTKIPLWKTEFRIDSKFVDVTFYAEDETVYALILHPQETEVSLRMQTVRICACGTNPIVAACQVSTFILISFIDDTLTHPADTGMYALSPSSLTLTAWNTPVSLGKSVTPTPGAVSFKEKTTGKLLVYVPRDALEDFHNNDLTYVVDPLTNEYQTIALDISADYFLSGSEPIKKLIEPLWRRNVKDPSVASIQDNSTLHLKHRGWLYRLVAKRKTTDARGAEIVIYDAPSADFYVEERMYCPPTLGWANGGEWEVPDIILFDAPYGGWGSPGDWRTPPSGPIKIGDRKGASRWADMYPSLADWSALQQKVRAISKSPGGGDPLVYTATWLGYHPDAKTVHYPGIRPPYKHAAGSYEISGAPNTVFDWADLGITDSDIVSVDIYRTAYTYPDPARTKSAGTGYDPYLYGFVGTIDKDGTFTDDIQDTALLFEQTPLQYDGYLAGQFAGEVIRPYQGHVVLGNTRTKNWLFTPWRGMQAFTYPAQGTDTYFTADELQPAPDGLPTTTWYYAYRDKKGHLSDASPIVSLQTYGGDSFALFDANDIAFLFPRGYSTTIDSVQLIRSVYSGGARTYYREAVVSLADGVYFSKNEAVTDVIAGVVKNADGSLALKDVERSVDPGYIIWSKTNDLWAWPQENIENEHDQDPVTGLDEVIGPLYVFSDRGVKMTRLNGYQEPVHTSATGVGAISRYAVCKVGKVVFMLSSSGLYFVEGSGVVQFPALIQTEIVKRLRENIAGQPTLYGVRNRASMHWLANRSELWLTFPSTVELDGVLPARTFVIKILEAGGRNEIYCYEFEIATQGVSAAYDQYAPENPAGLVIHWPHADGTMFSAFFDPGAEDSPDPSKRRGRSLVIQDNDDPRYEWRGQWAFQYENSMGAPNVMKSIFQVNLTAECRSRFWLTTGLLRDDGGYDRRNGTIVLASPPREVRPLSRTTRSEYHLPVSGGIEETSGTPPAFRIYGEPNEFFENQFVAESFDLFFGPLHAHKGD